MWTLEDHERAALADASQLRARKEVVDHARAKLALPDDVDEAALRGDLERSYDQADQFLRDYPNSSYKSYVFMTLIYTTLKPEVMRSPEPWIWLKNDRVGINTRVDLAYRMTKQTVNGGA